MFGSKLTPTAAPALAPAQRSKYGGISCADTRDPMLGLGTYRVRVVACAEGFNPRTRRESYKVTLHVLRAEPGSTSLPGTSATMLAFLTPAGLSELKRFAMHAAGFGPTLGERGGIHARAQLLDGEAQYDALDERCGHSGAILEASARTGEEGPSLVGRLVDVQVTMGKPVGVEPEPDERDDRDYYRVYAWGAVPEAEQIT